MCWRNFVFLLELQAIWTSDFPSVWWMVWYEKNWPGGIYASERFSVLALVICCIPGRLWTFMKRRMPWTLWQKTEFITLLQSHQKMPGIRGSSVRFVHSVQVWHNYSWESVGNIITSLLLEKRGDLFQSDILCLLGGTTPTLGTPCCSYWDGCSAYQSQDCHLLMWLWASWIQGLLQDTHKTLI